MTEHWIASGGGPVVCLPREHAAAWSADDLARARGAGDPAGILPGARGAALVLAGGPPRTAFVPSHTALVQWDGTDPAVPDPFGGQLCWRPGPKVWITAGWIAFDASLPGAALDDGTVLGLGLKPGPYVLRTADTTTHPQRTVRVHQFSPVVLD